MKRESILALLLLLAISCGPSEATPTPYLHSVWVDCPGIANDVRVCKDCSLGNWWAERGVVFFQVIASGGSITLKSAPGDCIPAPGP